MKKPKDQYKSEAFLFLNYSEVWDSSCENEIRLEWQTVKDQEKISRYPFEGKI